MYLWMHNLRVCIDECISNTGLMEPKHQLSLIFVDDKSLTNVLLNDKDNFFILLFIILFS
jgi:hypothetical protein